MITNRNNFFYNITSSVAVHEAIHDIQRRSNRLNTRYQYEYHLDPSEQEASTYQRAYIESILPSDLHDINSYLTSVPDHKDLNRYEISKKFKKNLKFANKKTTRIR